MSEFSEIVTPVTVGHVRLQLHVMQLVSAVTTSGPSVHAFELSKQLTQMGHRVTIVARPGSWIADQAKSGRFDLILSNQHRFPPTEILRLGREVVNREVDILHTHMSRAHTMGVLLRYWCNVPCVATAHCQKIQLHWPLNNFVISTSRSTERFQRGLNFVSKSKIDTLYCPVRQSDRPISYQGIQKIRRQFGDRDPKSPSKLIGVVGEISHAKGHQYLMDAFYEIAKLDPAARLVIVGNNRESYVKKMQQMAIRLGIEQRVCWAGYRGDIENVMRAFDVYVCASLRESLPLTLIEAMVAGRPIVATDVGGISEIIEHQNTGLLIKPARVDLLVQNICRLLQDPDLCQRLGARAMEVTQQKFDPETQFNKIENLYYRLTKVGSQSDERRFSRPLLSTATGRSVDAGRDELKKAA